MNYELMYEGNDPPGSFDGLAVIGKITDAEAVTMFKAGRLLNANYSLILRDGKQTFYFTPPFDGPAPQPKPPTTKQQILDQIAVLKSLADQLP